MNRHKLTVALVAATAVAATFAVRGLAYSTFGKWRSSPVTFYINSQNSDVDPAAAEAAIQVGMDAWHTQATSGIDFLVAGRVNDTTTGYDGKNVIVFRNASSASGHLATTYWWTSGDSILDADIIFWDGAYRFFTGSSGCEGGAFIEDVAAHELGHAIGLQHSTAADATMYPSYSYCSQDMRTLAADDIAGAQSLYPARTSSNSAPTVSIASPADGGVSEPGTVFAFSGSASDYEQGSLSGRLSWASTIDGQIGTGASFTRTLSPGTHTIRAQVQDSGGLVGYSQISLTVNASSPAGGPTLRVRGYKVKGVQKVDLTWEGFTAGSVDVLRNGALVTTTPNDNAQTDTIKKGGGTYNYQLCAAGTTACSNTANVTF